MSYIEELIVKKNKLWYNVLKVGDNLTKRKAVRNAKKRIFLFFVFFGTIIGSLSYSFFSNVNKIIQMKDQKEALKDKLSNLKEEEEILNSDIKKLEDPDYVARYAREKYLYSKDGELIIRIPEDDE